MSVFSGIRLILIIGVLLDWIGSLCNSFGNVFMRKHGIRDSVKDNPEVCSGMQQFKVLSLSFFTAGAISDTVSLAMIPLSTWACNTAISIPMSALVAKVFLGEKMAPLQWISVIIITFGSTGSLMFGSHDHKNDVLHSLIATFSNAYGISLCTLVIIIEGTCIHFTLKRVRLLREVKGIHGQEKSVLERARRSFSHSVSQPNVWLKISPATDAESIHDPSEDFRDYSDLNLTSSEKLGYLVAAGMSAALQTCWTSLLMKAITQIIRNLFNSTPIPVVAWACLPAIVCSALVQLTFIQHMLLIFEAVIIVPVYQCLLIIMTAMFGVVFFQEYPVSNGGFVLMVFLVCFGISIIMFVPDASGVSRWQKKLTTDFDLSVHSMDQNLLHEEVDSKVTDSRI